MHNKITPIFI